MAEKRPLRILVAKPGLDGHDVSAKLLVKYFKDHGMEAIYTGLHQTVDQIVSAALQEDVDVIVLNILSGAHLGYTRRILQRMQQEGIGDKVVLVGGTIPIEDVPKLKEMGVAEVFPTGSTFEDGLRWLREHFGAERVGTREG